MILLRFYLFSTYNLYNNQEIFYQVNNASKSKYELII